MASSVAWAPACNFRPNSLTSLPAMVFDFTVRLQGFTVAFRMIPETLVNTQPL